VTRSWPSRALLFTALAAIPATGFAAPRDDAKTAERPVHGRPTVKLDKLDVSHAPLAALEEKYLRDILAREAKHVDWGAGKKSKIEYRFRVDELVGKSDGKVFRVSCSASGWLPKGRPAKSRVAFGGSPDHRDDLVRQVLDVVARGVLTRLAEIERHRRHLED
jgi:hypothetical protein